MRGWFQGRASTVLAFVLGLVIATAATAGAASLITGKQIKDGTITQKDLAKALRSQLAKAGLPGPKGDPGPPGPKGDAGARGEAGPGAAKIVAALNAPSTATAVSDSVSGLRASITGCSTGAVGSQPVLAFSSSTSGRLIANEKQNGAGTVGISPPVGPGTDATFPPVTNDLLVDGVYLGDDGRMVEVELVVSVTNPGDGVRCRLYGALTPVG